MTTVGLLGRRLSGFTRRSYFDSSTTHPLHHPTQPLARNILKLASLWVPSFLRFPTLRAIAAESSKYLSKMGILPWTGAPAATILSCTPSEISFSSESSHHRDEGYHILPGSSTLAAIEAATHHLATLRQPVVIPTETVYGLAAPATDSHAVSQIFSIKGRPADNPLIVHVSSRTMLQSILPPTYSIPRTYEKLMDAFWPGPLTLLFPADPSKIPPIVTAGHATVAIRMPSHPVARALIAHSHLPLAAPSANSSGKPSPTRADHVWRDLGESGKVSLILDGGPCDVGVESTVVDGITAADGNLRVLRPGGVTVEDISRVLSEGLANGEQAPKVLVHKRDYDDKAVEEHPTTPGMKYLHYSPSVPVYLWSVVDETTVVDKARGEPIADALSNLILPKVPNHMSPKTVGILSTTDSPLVSWLQTRSDVNLVPFDLGPRNTPAVAAHRLFDGLLTLEKKAVDLIIVEAIDEEREGLAVMNRLRKAAKEEKIVHT